MKNKIDMDNYLTGCAAIILFILLFFIFPWLSFWIAYFCGWIAKITIGKYLVEGFALFGITIPIDKIPLCAGILGWIGQFFQSVIKTKN